MRDYTKFFTYPDTAAFMAKLLNPKPGQEFIEPSAGNGALVKAVKDICPDAIVDGVELYEKWKEELMLAGCRQVFIQDFLDINFFKNCYDGCIANPPFGNGIDLQAHFDKICYIVRPGGKVVMIVPSEFNPNYLKHLITNVTARPLKNWSPNSDGTVTKIKIFEFNNSF